MNKTKIEWTDYSWNPITGCKHGCWYCYAKKLAQRFKKVFPYGFEPHFYPERLKEPWDLETPSRIFACSIADLFSPWQPTAWRDAVLRSIAQCPVKHIFQLLTKQPEHIPVTYRFPENVHLGVTVTCQGEVPMIETLKAQAICDTLYVSFEPLLGLIEFPFDELDGINWVIIGKLTGSRRVQLQDEWVDTILEEASKHRIPVFMKNNLKSSYNGAHWFQQYPKDRWYI